MRNRITQFLRPRPARDNPCFWCVEHPLADMRCSACGDDESHVNLFHIEANEVIYCERHKIFTVVGANLFSSWKFENPAIWRSREKYLNDFTEAPVYHPGQCKGAPREVLLGIIKVMDRLNDELTKRFHQASDAGANPFFD